MEQLNRGVNAWRGMIVSRFVGAHARPAIINEMKKLRDTYLIEAEKNKELRISMRKIMAQSSEHGIIEEARKALK